MTLVYIGQLDFRIVERVPLISPKKRGKGGKGKLRFTLSIFSVTVAVVS